MDKKLMAVTLIAIMSLVIAIIALSEFYNVITESQKISLINSATPVSTSSTKVSPMTKPEPTFQQSWIAIQDNETNREEIGGNTQVTLSLNATYINGSPVTVSYSDFNIQLYTLRMSMQDKEGTVYPLNKGSFALSSANRTEIFELTFEFSTYGFNGMDTSTNEYFLQYNGSASVQWIPQYH